MIDRAVTRHVNTTGVHWYETANRPILLKTHIQLPPGQSPAPAAAVHSLAQQYTNHSSYVVEARLPVTWFKADNMSKIYESAYFDCFEFQAQPNADTMPAPTTITCESIPWND
ncbi:MAG: hypothetical protein AB7I09_16375 [Planctomycetota bacterium]